MHVNMGYRCSGVLVIWYRTSVIAIYGQSFWVYGIVQYIPVQCYNTAAIE